MISAKPDINYKIDTMKKNALLIFILFGLNVHSQTYVLDNTFGNSGTISYTNGLHVKNGLLVNSNYYFISSNTIAKMDYNGQIVIAFGTNGIKALQQTNETLTIVNFVFFNNYFYIYGSVKNNTTNNIDIYISRIDENGNYDSSFGTNGIVKLDFGLQENISSFLTESSGSLYCIGTRFNQNVTNSSRLILFKINNNGSINTSFNLNGFKEISLDLSTSGSEILPYNSQFMLLGTTTANDGTYNRTKILITEVDSNGNSNTSFGINGFKTIPLANSGIYYNSIKNVQLLNTTLYINMNQGGAMLGDNSNNLLIYNLINDQIVSSVSHNEFFYNQITDNKIFLTSYCYTCCGTNYYACDNTFELRKFNLDGTTDSSFHINGLYSYEFNYVGAPGEPVGGDSRSYVFIKEPSGKILIAGYVYRIFSTIGFSALRIVDGALGLNSIVPDDKNYFYPNPFDNKIIFKNTKPIKNVDVYDLVGRKINKPSFQYENDNTTIDLSNIIEKGTYLLRITTEQNEIITEKIIKS